MRSVYSPLTWIVRISCLIAHGQFYDPMLLTLMGRQHREYYAFSISHLEESGHMMRKTLENSCCIFC